MQLDFDMLREADGIITAFQRAGIRYAVAGGFAVAIHGRIRATKDIDFLCHPDDLDRAIICLSELGYNKYAEPWTFRSTTMTLHRYMRSSRESELFHVVDILVPPPEHLNWITEAEQVAWGQRDKASVVSRKNLIEMKTLRGSELDQGDINFLEGRG